MVNNMKIAMVASGSKGNMCYIESEGTKILIDAGISCKRLTKFLDDNKIEGNFSGILITHEHTDHISGLLQITKKYKCPLYMTEGTRRGIREKSNGISIIDNNDIRIIGQRESFEIGDFFIESFPTFHDVYEPCCYKVTAQNKSIVYITDTGYVPTAFYELLSNASCYVMEVNHDPELLMNSSRPYETRVRILGDSGHLSNEDGLDLLSHIMGENTKVVFYAHISEECNLWNIIESESKRIYEGYSLDVSGIRFIYTNQLSTEVISL